MALTSTEPAAGTGSVINTMQSPSGGDAVPDLDPEKEAEGEEDDGDVFADPTQEPSHDSNDGQNEEGDLQEEELEGEEEEWGDREEEEGLEPEDEIEEEEVDEGPKYAIEAEEVFPEEEEEELLKEEVEEYEYTKEEIKYMKTAFAAYQIEKPQKKKGFTPRKKEPKEIKVTEIPVNTLSSVLRSLGLNPTQAALKRYADWLDADPVQGVVKFEELLIIVGREKKVIIDESHVLEAFRSIDIENNERISNDTLRELLVLRGERFNPEEWIIFIHLADPKATGLVDYEDFVARMGPNPPPQKKKGKKGKKGKRGKK